MNAQPVRKAARPKYPTKLEAAADPDLLARGAFSLPPVVIAAAGIALACETGVTGCIVITPPAFVSEEEALAIIRAEMGRAGVTLVSGTEPLPGVFLLRPKGACMQPEEQPSPFTPDLVSPDGEVVIEYISKDDLGCLYRDRPIYEHPVTFEMAQAELTARVLAVDPHARAGLFRDPCLDEYESEATRRDRLRVQVVQFIEWLRGQGAL